MKMLFVALTIALTAGFAFGGQRVRTFTGVISDSMCLRDHAMMKVSPDSKCVTECVKASQDIRYSLIDGKNAYTLSDRKRPAAFAAQKVSVKGVLNAKTNVIEVESIEPLQ